VRTHAAQIFKEAQDLLPGGVNSPVRAFKRLPVASRLPCPRVLLQSLDHMPLLHA